MLGFSLLASYWTNGRFLIRRVLTSSLVMGFSLLASYWTNGQIFDKLEFDKLEFEFDKLKFDKLKFDKLRVLINSWFDKLVGMINSRV